MITINDMDNNTETQLILNSLYKERADLTKQLTDLERVIKKIKLGTFTSDLAANNLAVISNTPETLDLIPEKKQIDFPLRGELRVQVISVFDLIGVACKLKDIQDKYKELTGLRPNLRETVRTLYNTKYSVYSNHAELNAECIGLKKNGWKERGAN